MSNNLFLDQQPELSNVIKTWLKGLELDKDQVSWEEDITEIDCRSRDGFIRASHNYGGFDKVYLSDVAACHCSGGGPSLPMIEEIAIDAYHEAKQRLKREYGPQLKGLSNDEIDYNGLHELGFPELAEKLSEFEDEEMKVSVFFGIRAMYEGKNEENVHTLMVYAAGNVGEYGGAFGKGCKDIKEWTVEFETAKDLEDKLAALSADVVAAF